MAIPREVFTGYAGYNYSVLQNNSTGFSFAEQCAAKLKAQYGAIIESGVPYTPAIFQDIINSITIDIEYNVCDLEPPYKLNNQPYPNWLKILYQVVNGINQDFTSSCLSAGWVDGMTFYQLFELLFPNINVALVSFSQDQIVPLQD